MVFLKRALNAFMVLLIGIFSSCQYLSPIDLEPVNTPLAPTMTPDPCSAENLSDEMAIIRSGFAEFQELIHIADNSRAENLIDPILKLEEIRTRITSLNLPGCLKELKTTFSEYSAVVIRYLTSRMQDPRSDEYKVDQQNSQTLWQAVEDEYEKAVLTVEMEFIPITGSTDAFDIEITSVVLAINDGSQSVNIRTGDGLDYAIVGRLEPGMQARVVGKNQAEEWLRINLPTVNGWVYLEMVEISGDLSEIPVISHN